MDPDLLMALLAMDSYNRGYGPGIKLPTSGLLGNVEIKTDSTLELGLAGTQAVGFFATAYRLASGKIVISYRGTNTDDILPDIVNGWTVGTTSPIELQAKYAVEFFNKVMFGGAVRTDGDPRSANVEFTGHSLGAGLAGLMGMLYDRQAVIFDHMPFEGAALNTYLLSLASSGPGTVGELVYGSSSPWLPNKGEVTAYATENEVLSNLRAVLATEQPEILSTYDADFPGAALIARHSQAMLALLLFGQKEWENSGHGNSWQKSAKYFLPALFSDAIADADSYSALEGVSGSSAKMQAALAYSIFNEGTTPFGNVGVRALFDDADDLGKVLNYTNVSQSIVNSATAISEIFVQYAGRAAINKVSDTGSATDGVLTLSSDGNTLSIDFADAVWARANGDGTAAMGQIIGRKRLTDSVLSTIGVGPIAQQPGQGGLVLTSDLRTGMHWLYGDTDSSVIDKVNFHTKETVWDTALPGRPAGSATGKVTLSVSAGADDHIIGSADNDMIFGGAGADTIRGGDGNDLIAGGANDDILSGGAGHNFIAGGAGYDTLDLGLEGAGTGVALTITALAPVADNERATVEIANGQDVNRLVNVEYVKLTSYSDTLTVTDLGTTSFFDLPPAYGLKIDFGGAGAPTINDDLIDLSAAGRHISDLNLFGISFGTVNAGVSVDLSDPANQTVDYRYRTGNSVLYIYTTDLGRHELLTANANSVIGTQYDDWIKGEGGARNSGEGYSTLRGGDGDDTLLAAGWETHMEGGAGSDSFYAGAGAFIDHADTNDRIYVSNLPIFGGVKPVWLKANYAIPQMFGAVTNAFPVIGAEIFAAAAILLDGFYMSLCHFASGADGSMAVRFGSGDHWAQTVVTNYKLDLDTGLGTAGLTVFEAGRADHWDAAELAKFVNLCLMQGFGRKFPGFDPIVLDLNGDGVSLWTAQNSPVYRDVNGTGFADRTGWARGGDGILVRDLDGNGSIDSAAEMFAAGGDAGYVGLADYDTNGDGKVDAADTGFGSLRIWVDVNGDGRTDAGELHTLAELGIASLSLGTTTTENDAIAGSTVTGRSTFTRTDGSTGETAEVTFSVDSTQTIYSGDLSVSAEAALLPQYLGIGHVVDLRVAASHDATLLDMLEDFVATTETDFASLLDQATAILLRWTHADGVTATPFGDFDAQRLAALEMLAGTELAPRVGGSVSDVNDSELNALWTSTITNFTLRLAIQGPLAGVFGNIEYLADRDMLLVDNTDDLADTFGAVLASLPAAAPEALAAWNDLGPLLSSLVAQLSWRHDSGPIAVDDGFALAALQEALADASSSLTLDQLAPALGYAHVETGTVGDDVLQRNGSGNFTFVSSGGHDTFNGGGGEDFYLIGADAGTITINDVEATPQGDTLQFSALNRADVTAARDGNDLVLTSLIDDTVVRVVGQFADVLHGGGGTILSVNRGVESIMFADGTLLEGGLGQISQLVGTGGDGNDTIAGTNQSDYLEGGRGDDHLSGGDDGDFYYYNAGDGNDVISDVMSNPLVKATDMLMFGKDIAPSDIAFVRVADGDDLVFTTGTGASASTITIAGQFGYNVLGTNQLFATNNAIETFMFEGYGESWSNTDIQQALIKSQTTSGADTTYGFGSNDIFYASAGNDLLIGLDGADTYNWAVGAGNDTIDERARFIDVNVGLGGISLSVEADVVQFDASIDPAHLIFTRDYDTDDLTVTNAATGETLTVDGQFNSYQTGVLGAQWFDRVEWFAFADSSAYSWQEVEAMVTTGSSGDDRLRGDIKADRMVGGAGDDLLSGGGGGDTYVFNAGDGHDTIFDDNATLIGDGFLTADQTVDTVELGAGIDPADVIFSRDGSSITLTFGTSGDSITLQGQDDYIQTGVFGAIPTSRVEQIVFDDGTVWTWQDVNQRMIAAQTTAGNDVTTGFTLADRFEKSAGDDVMRGGESGDTYVFGVGAGHDRIEESVDNVLYGDDDSVEFDGSVAVADVSVARDGNDLILTLTSGDSLRVAGEFDLQTLYTWTDVENFRFADGTVWSKTDVQQKLLEATAGNDHLIGFYSGDDLDGLAGNDILEGGDGGDTYHFGRGYGNDEIRESVTEVNVGDFDQVAFGPALLPEDLNVARDGNDLVFTIIDTGETLRVTNQFNFSAWFSWNDVELFTFANGTQWTDLQIAARLTGGTAGDDHLIGTFRSDTLDGKEGDDLLEGADGSDIYIFGRGYGHDEIRESLTEANLGEDDEVRFGANITLADLGFTRDGDNLIISIAGTDDTLKLTGEFTYSTPYTWNDVERFTFADGSFITKQDISQIVLTGTSADEHIIGFGSGDTIDGKSGDDILEGRDGSDIYRFGVGDGHDQIWENLDDGRSSEDDTLSFKNGVLPGDVTVTRDGQDAIFTLTSGDSIRVVGQFNEGYNEFLSFNDVERATFADGTVWDKIEIDRRSIHTTTGDDLMLGSRYEQTYDGGAGNDTIYAGNNSDILIGGTGNDHLEGDGGDDVYRYNVGDGDDVIHDYNYGNDGADRIVFGAGIAPGDLRFANNPADATEIVISFTNIAGSITVQNQWWGDAGIEFLEFADGTVWDQAQISAAWVAGQATAGDDLIFGSSGDDVVSSGTGNDRILAGDGNDRLKGGAGNDRLEGASGYDTYVYNLGDGDDVIFDYNFNNDQGDRVVLGAGITTANIRFSSDNNGNNLKITFAGSPGSILVENQWWSDAGIESIKFADGTVWRQDQIVARFLADQSTSGDDVIYSPLGGAVDGGSGDDVIHTGDAVDIITGGVGNDRLESGYGNDSYIYNLGDGNDVIYDYSWNNDQADRIVFGAGVTPGTIHLANNGNGGDLRVTFDGSAGSILIQSQWQGDAGVEFFEFSDGTIWDQSQIAARFLADQSTSGNDVIFGSPFGGALNAGSGNDVVHTGDNDDIITGGTGNDRLESGYGNDRYIYNLGDGNDVIYDYSWNNDQADRIVFGAGITPEDVLIDTQANGSLRVTFKHADGSITVENQNWGDAGVEFFDFDDGTIWNLAQINAHIGSATSGADILNAGSAGQEIWALEGNDRLNGSAAADSLHGQAGNDTIYGFGSDDVVDGGSGDDVLFGDDDPASSLTAVGANLIVNGSFETSGTVIGGGGWGIANDTLPGWTKDNSQPFEQVYATGGVSPTDGTFWLDMDSAGGSGSNMSINQTIADLTDGAIVRLQFDHANRTGADNGGLEVYWNGVLVATYTDYHPGMQSETLDLIAGSGDNVVTFKGTGYEDNTGASLDNVRLHLTIAASAASGDDILTGGAGDDVIDGGGGDDIAAFTGAAAGYSVTENPDGSYTVEDLVANRDGTDLLTNIELLRFSDGDVAPDDFNSGGGSSAAMAPTTGGHGAIGSPIDGLMLNDVWFAISPGQSIADGVSSGWSGVLSNGHAATAIELGNDAGITLFEHPVFNRFDMNSIWKLDGESVASASVFDVTGTGGIDQAFADNLWMAHILKADFISPFTADFF